MSRPESHNTHNQGPEAATQPRSEVRGESVQQALDRGLQLVGERGEGPYAAVWHHEATHVGDLSILAIPLMRSRADELSRAA